MQAHACTPTYVHRHGPEGHASLELSVQCMLSYTHLAYAVTPVVSQSCLLDPETPALPGVGSGTVGGRGGYGGLCSLWREEGGMRQKETLPHTHPLWGQAPSSRRAKSWACCPAERQGHLHGDRLTLDFCCIELEEGREVTAGPGSPEQLWPEADSVITPNIPSPLGTRDLGCPSWPPLRPILPPVGSFPNTNYGGLPALPLT